MPNLLSMSPWCTEMWLALASAATILMDYSLTRENSNHAYHLLKDEFLPVWRERYGPGGSTVVCHMALHEADDCVILFGPPSAWWLFAMERGNGVLTRHSFKDERPTLHLRIARVYHSFLRDFAEECIQKDADAAAGVVVAMQHKYPVSKERGNAVLSAEDCRSLAPAMALLVEDAHDEYDGVTLLPHFGSCRLSCGVLLSSGTDVLVRGEDASTTYVCRLGQFFIWSGYTFFHAVRWYGYPNMAQQRRFRANEYVGLSVLTVIDTQDEVCGVVNWLRCCVFYFFAWCASSHCAFPVVLMLSCINTNRAYGRLRIFCDLL